MVRKGTLFFLPWTHTIIFCPLFLEWWTPSISPAGAIYKPSLGFLVMSWIMGQKYGNHIKLICESAPSHIFICLASTKLGTREHLMETKCLQADCHNMVYAVLSFLQGAHSSGCTIVSSLSSSTSWSYPLIPNEFSSLHNNISLQHVIPSKLSLGTQMPFPFNLFGKVHLPAPSYTPRCCPFLSCLSPIELTLKLSNKHIKLTKGNTYYAPI